MPALNIDQSTAKRIEAGAGAIVLKGRCKNYEKHSLGRPNPNFKMLSSNYTPKFNCYFDCYNYEHRFSEGTIYFYQGMGGKKYCTKNKPCHVFPNQYESSSGKCLLGTCCILKGAKLVNKAKILKSYPIMFEVLTEEIAARCGFGITELPQDLQRDRLRNMGVVVKSAPQPHWKSGLYKLECILKEKYNAKPGDIFQVVEFEKKVKQ